MKLSRRMIRSIKYLCGLFAVMAYLTAFHAQGQTMLEKELAKNKQLSATVQALTDSCDQLADSVQSMRNDLKLKQDTWDYNDSIIKDANNGVQQKNLKAMQKQVESLDKEVQELRNDSIDLMAKKNKLVAQIKDAEKELDNMDEARAVKAQQDADKAKAELVQRYEKNLQLLKKRYSQISEVELNEISATVDDFKGIIGKKEFDEYKKRVAAAIKNKQLFEKADTLLRQPYSDEVGKTHNLLYNDNENGLLQIKKDNIAKGVFRFCKEDFDGKGSQYDEMDNLDKYLSRYKDGVKALKDIINQVNQNSTVKSYRNSNNSKECWKAIENVLKSYKYKDREYNDVVERYFAHIPYLNIVFSQYLEQSQRSPLQEITFEKIYNNE